MKFNNWIEKITKDLKQPFVDLENKLDEREKRHEKGFRYISNDSSPQVKDKEFFKDVFVVVVIGFGLLGIASILFS